MLGPTAEDLDDRTATGTSEAGVRIPARQGRDADARLLEEEVTATYAGLRAAIDHGDYLIEADAGQRYVLVGGIRSTGLTSGMAIAEYVAELARDAGAGCSCPATTCPRRRGCPTSARRSPARTRTPP